MKRHIAANPASDHDFSIASHEMSRYCHDRSSLADTNRSELPGSTGMGAHHPGQFPRVLLKIN
jgi:hypothetical protein